MRNTCFTDRAWLSHYSAIIKITTNITIAITIDTAATIINIITAIVVILIDVVTALSVDDIFKQANLADALAFVQAHIEHYFPSRGRPAQSHARSGMVPGPGREVPPADGLLRDEASTSRVQVPRPHARAFPGKQPRGDSVTRMGVRAAHAAGKGQASSGASASAIRARSGRGRGRGKDGGGW